MRAGRLRWRVVIQKLSNQRDSLGQLVDEWVTVCRERAEIRDISGREYLASQAEQNQTDCRITMRHRNDITPDMRILCNGVFYNIRAVLTDLKKTHLELQCQKTGVEHD